MSSNNIHASSASSAMQALAYEHTPVGRLSQDVVQYIFEKGTWSTDDYTDSLMFPLRVSHVCRAWCALARATPTLWTLITFKDSSPTPHFHLNRQRLRLSQECPLTLFLDLRIPSWKHDSENANPVDERLVKRMFYVLHKHFKRIRSFSVLADTFSPIHCTLQLMQTQHMPRLDCFRVEWASFYTILDKFSPAYLAGPVPLLDKAKTITGHQLQSMSLLGVPIDWSRWTSTNLVQLTIYCLSHETRPSVMRFRDMIGSCAHSLKYLEIQGAAPLVRNYNGHGWCPPIQSEARAPLPQLTELVLGHVEPEESVLMISLFRYPALKALTLRNICCSFTPRSARGQFTYNSRQVVETLCRNDTYIPSVERLTLDGIYTELDSFLPLYLLLSFPILRSLVIKDSSNKFVAALALVLQKLFPNSNPRALPSLPCPLLRDLTLVSMDASIAIPVLHCRAVAAAPTHGMMSRLASVAVYDAEWPVGLSPQQAQAELARVADVVSVEQGFQGANATFSSDVGESDDGDQEV